MSASSRPSTIPGVLKFHRREAWQSSKEPVTGPSINWSGIDTFPLHYTAADDLIDGDPGEYEHQLPQYLRNIQHHYLGRGYSIGYNFAVDWLGGVWELRGFDIKCAANKNWNGRTLAILCLVDGDDPVTTQAAISIRAIRDEAERRRGHSLNLVPHSEIGSTACCGDGIRSQISHGVFDIGDIPPPPPSSYNPPKSWGLYPLNKSKPWTKKGDRGNYVRYIQDVIYFKAGGNIARDAVFGAQTERRVKDLQGFFKQKQTGSVSNGGQHADNTWGVIDMLTAPVKPPPPPPPAIVFDPENGKYGLYPLNKSKPKLRWEDRGDLVRYLTGVLRSPAVDLSIDVTDYYDSEVADGVRLVQRWNGLPVTGWVPAASEDPRFWHAIDSYASE